MLGKALPARRESRWDGYDFSGTSDERWAIFRCCCGSERLRVWFGEKTLSKHIRLVMAAGEGSEMLCH